MPQLFAADYFAEEVRRELGQMYGEKTLYEGGLSVRTSLDPKLQVMARKALMDGLVEFDRQRGWRGPVKHIDAVGEDWGVTVAEVPALADVIEWRLAVVLGSGDGGVADRPAARPRAGHRQGPARARDRRSSRPTA